MNLVFVKLLNEINYKLCHYSHEMLYLCMLCKWMGRVGVLVSVGMVAESIDKNRIETKE